MSFMDQRDGYYHIQNSQDVQKGHSSCSLSQRDKCFKMKNYCCSQAANKEYSIAVVHGGREWDFFFFCVPGHARFSVR